MPGSDDNPEKWKQLPPATRVPVPHGSDGPPSEYGIPVGVDDHPLRRFYREAEAEARKPSSGDAR
jgi:hypothetical protein